MRDASLIRGDARTIPLADNSVDLIVTSPPYFSLRSYRDGGEHLTGQIGAEATPREFLEALWCVSKECWRVLKPTGSLFVNLGDKRSGAGGHNNAGLSTTGSTLEGTRQQKRTGGAVHATRRNAPDRYNQAAFGRPKSKMLLPHRYAIGCEDGLGDPDGVGWIVRQDIVWCLSGGARVYARLQSGDRPMMIRDLVRAYRPENVQLWNGTAWTQVLGWNRSTDDDEAIEIELRSGERIGCTRGHQWPTARGLLRADEIRVGDIIETTRLPEPEPTKYPAGLMADEVGWFIGMYLAEGSRSEQILQFAGHADETERHRRLAMIAEAYHGTCAVYPTSENGATCHMTGPVLLGIIDRYISSGTACTKRLTMHAWQRSNQFLAAVMAGYLEGDGHYDAKNDRWRLAFTANDELAADLRSLAARLGASISLRRRTFHGFDRAWPGWHGEWRWATTTHANTKSRAEVVTIRASRARQFWDIGVADEPHLFALASGVLTHNSKRNGMPESVRDRVRDCHEYWFHLTKQGDYFAAIDEVREPHEESTFERAQYPTGKAFNARNSDGTVDGGKTAYEGPNPLGRVPGSVWPLASEPLVVPDEYPDHFAAFPQELPRRLILGWSPSGICLECGEGRRPILDVTLEETGHTNRRLGHGKRDLDENDGNDRGFNGSGYPIARRVATIVGYRCACDTTSAPTRPAVVLDPFGGTGTVAMVARVLGRYGVSMDLSSDYLRLARWRIWESGHAAKSIERTWGERQGNLFG